MQFSAFVLLAVAAVTMAAPADPIDPFPAKGEVWIETPSGDTEAYLTDDGKAWQWASETAPGPQIALFETHPEPTTVVPGELTTSLSLDGNTCRFDANDLLDCSAEASANDALPKAIFQAKFQTDAVGDKRWFLLGPDPEGGFYFKQIDQELQAVSTKDGEQYTGPLFLYIREPFVSSN